MSFDAPLPEPPEALPPSPVTPLPPVNESPALRPYPAEWVEDEEVLTPEEVRPSARPASASDQPAPSPHPGFWWSLLWCVVALIVVAIGDMAIGALLVVIEAARAGSLNAGLQAVANPGSSHSFMIAAMVWQHICFIALPILGLRLVAGKDWAREVAFRLPAWGHLLLILLVWPALSLVASGSYAVVKSLIPGLDHFLTYAITFGMMLGVVTVAWTGVRLSTGRDWVPHLAASNLPAQLVLSTIGVVAVLAVASVLFRAFSSFIPPFQFIEPGIMEEMVKQFREWPPGLAVLLVGVGPGLGEELWCRAFLGRGLVGRHGVVMGVILTSFFFGAIHADPHQGSMAALMGLALHFSYITTRSLWVPILIHTLNNSLAVVADKLPDALKHKIENAETAPETVELMLYMASVCLVVAIGWALYASRARLRRVDGSDEPAWRPPFPGVALPPKGSGTAAVASWPGVLPVVGVLLGLAAFVGAFLLVPGN